MLQSLHVHNFALLEDAQAEFSSGFNVFTGETGAGKSILIDAFSVALGARASADYIRSGADSFWVQAVFEVTEASPAAPLLAEQGIEPEDGQLMLRRQVNSSGKGRAFVNGVQVSVAFLKRLGGALVDIHGQHENQALLREDTPRLLTDAYGGAVLAAALEAYKAEHAEFVRLKKLLQRLQASDAEQERLLDRCQWEMREIEDAKLKAGEEEALSQEARLLQHSEKIIGSVSSAYNYLDEEKGVLARLAQAKTELAAAARYDERLQALCDGAESAWLTLEDCRQELGDYLSRSEFNSQRATAVQERLDLIYRLQKKYGGSTQEVLAYLERVKEKYEELQNLAAAIADAEKKLAAIKKRLLTAAGALTAARREAAQRLGKAVTEHIRDLAMPDGQFVISVQPAAKITAEGLDELSFQFSANLGEPLNALEKVASGGELSRIALALKTVLIAQGGVGTMVFDEIDTGVGGVTAQRMAEKIAVIAGRGQVLCITHLPQIAAFADRHIYIAKESTGGRTATTLTVLDKAGRVEELIRMTAGASASAAARENACELLQGAAEFKAQHCAAVAEKG